MKQMYVEALDQKSSNTVDWSSKGLTTPLSSLTVIRILMA